MGSNHLHNNNEEDMEGADFLKKHLRFKEPPLSTDKAALWAKIDAEIKEGGKVKSIRSRRRPIYYLTAAAAVIVLLLAFFFIRPEDGTSISAPIAATQTLNLPDQSKVLLNAGSEVFYKENKWEEERKVKLTGEAFFEVEKGSKFTVSTKSGDITVLGTAFNVRAWKNGLVVSCEEGRVAVKPKKAKEEILTQGQEVRLNANGELVRREVEEVKIATWRTDHVFLVDYSRAEILAELERQFNIEIKDESGAQDEVYEFDFKKTDSIEEIIKNINFVFALDGKLINNQLILK